MDTESPIGSIKSFLLVRVIGGIILGCVVVLGGFLFLESSSPAGFVPDTVVHVGNAASLTSVGMLLKNDGVIRSTTLFRVAVAVVGGSHTVNIGDYYFPTSSTVWQVAYRITHNDQGLMAVKVTFPEGTSIRGMGEILGKTFTATSSVTHFIFDTAEFAVLASTSEGYLFPDTYFFSPNVSPTTVISTLKANFTTKLATVMPAITASGRSVHDIVIMASILEKEALTDADRRTIAGILWKRIDSGTPLQVDSPFAYAIGKTSAALTTTDLQVDSPFNTYRHKGLPATPINNPGTEALMAAASPASTTYWYYLSDSKGTIHYASTYDQHLENRQKYLGK